MASLNGQGSRVVLIVVVLLKSFITTDAIKALSNEKLADVFKQLNKSYELTQNTAQIGNLEQKVRNTYSHKNQTGFDNISIQRRSEGRTPWQCESQINWRDLGNLHYPRFVKEVLCLGDSCMHGFYSCQSQNYSIRVLSARETEDDQDIALPWILRQDWKFMDIQISVGCICGN